MWKDNYQKQWYYKHREEQIQKNREWKLTNRERLLAQKKEHYILNKEKILEHKRQYRSLHPEKSKEYRQRPEVKKKRIEQEQKRRTDPNRSYLRKCYEKEYHRKNKTRIAEYSKQHSQLPEVKARRNELARKRERSNPHSNRGAEIQLQNAMNNVRRRDKNTCQWQGCGLTYRQAPIHVHHIFPRSEYPELELVEQYLICFCANHHALWHRYRGDPYSEMISPRYQETALEKVIEK